MRNFHRLKASVFIALLSMVLCGCQPPVEKPTKREIIIYGDSQQNHFIHRLIVKRIVSLQPRIVFHLGDLVQEGNVKAEWDKFNEITADMRKAAEFYPVLGNHDEQAKYFFENFDLPNNEQWYVVRDQEASFVLLNTNVKYAPGSAQYDWIVKTLAQERRASKFLIVLFHHSPFSSVRDEPMMKKVREQLIPLLEKYDVDLVFNGHNHSYERSIYHGIPYITTAGGGGRLYPEKNENSHSVKFLRVYNFCALSYGEDEIVVEAFDLNFKLIDEITVKAKRQYAATND